MKKLFILVLGLFICASCTHLAQAQQLKGIKEKFLRVNNDKNSSSAPAYKQKTSQDYKYKGTNQPQYAENQTKKIQTPQEEETCSDMCPGKQIPQAIRLAPTKNYALPNNTNMAYSMVFDIAWYKLKEYIGGPLRFPVKINLAEELNKTSINLDDIDANSYLALVGTKKDNIEENIRKQLKAKFNTESINLDNLNFNNACSGSLLSYSYLAKNLKFPYAFNKLKGFTFTSEDGTKTPVQAFGFQEKNAEESQIEVKHYQKDSIISISSEDGKEEIILASIPKQKSIKQAIDYTFKQIKENPFIPDESYNYKYTFAAPKIDFDATERFSSLICKNVLNYANGKHKIQEAIETIKFHLDERGAILTSEAVAMVGTYRSAGMESKIKYLDLIFDKPFLIMMKKKGNHQPYFALWAANADILIAPGKKIVQPAPKRSASKAKEGPMVPKLFR